MTPLPIQHPCLDTSSTSSIPLPIQHAHTQILGPLSWFMGHLLPSCLTEVGGKHIALTHSSLKHTTFTSPHGHTRADPLPTLYPSPDPRPLLLTDWPGLKFARRHTYIPYTQRVWGRYRHLSPTRHRLWPQPCSSCQYRASHSPHSCQSPTSSWFGNTLFLLMSSC